MFIVTEVRSWYGDKKKWLNKTLSENQVAICVLFGLIGFIYSVLIITWRQPFSEKIYGEITVANKNEILENLVQCRIERLTEEKAMITSRYENALDTPGEPKNQKKKAAILFDKKVLTDLIKSLSDSRKELEALQYHDSGSDMKYFAMYLSIPRDSFTNLLQNKDWNGRDTLHTIKVTLIDTCRRLSDAAKIKKGIDLKLIRHKRTSLLSFLGDYPVFGFWTVITIAQMMIWFIIIPLLKANVLHMKQNLGKHFLKISLTSRCVNFLLPFFFILIFCVLFYWVLADNLLITDSYFLSAYNKRMIYYAVPGYLAAVYCLSCYLSVSQQFDGMNKSVERNSKLLSNTLFTSRFLSLKYAFENTFLFSTIILSLMIFWTGLIVNALNQTEIFQLYFDVSQKLPIPDDFIYMMGILHTSVLLTFYVPVKLKISSMKIGQPEAMIAGGAPVSGIFDKLLSQLGGILLTTSPIIASFIQDIIKLLFPASIE